MDTTTNDCNFQLPKSKEDCGNIRNISPNNEDVIRASLQQVKDNGFDAVSIHIHPHEININLKEIDGIPIVRSKTINIGKFGIETSK